MATVSGLISQALMLIGDLRPGYTPSNDVLNVGMETANSILSQWSGEGTMIPTVAVDTAVMTVSVAVYTYGPSGTINSSRPLQILAAKSVANNIPLPVEIIRTAAEWAAFSIDDAATGSYASGLFCDYAQPQATLRLWPIPSNESTLYLYALKPLTSFAALGDTVSLHPGYEHALVHAIAVEVAPKLRLAVPETVLAEAGRAKAALAALNEAVLQAWAKEAIAQ